MKYHLTIATKNFEKDDYWTTAKTIKIAAKNFAYKMIECNAIEKKDLYKTINSILYRIETEEQYKKSKKSNLKEMIIDIIKKII